MLNKLLSGHLNFYKSNLFSVLGTPGANVSQPTDANTLFEKHTIDEIRNLEKKIRYVHNSQFLNLCHYFLNNCHNLDQ